MTIIGGACCEEFNPCIKGSLVSSHMPNENEMCLAINIVCINLQALIKVINGVLLSRGPE
jgi:hypothetical protein